MNVYLKNNARGFTLVEVLVAVVILSIGLLAVAGMQITSLKGGNNALYRTQAVLAAEDIMDRMRANRSAALSGSYYIELTAPAPTTPATLADEDLAEWKNTLSINLPSGDGSVVVAAGEATVVVEWQDSYGAPDEDDENDRNNRVRMVTRL